MIESETPDTVSDWGPKERDKWDIYRRRFKVQIYVYTYLDV